MPEIPMTDAEFDTALIAAAMADAAQAGWRHLSIARAARDAGLDLARARARLPSPAALLLRLGAAADRVALSDAAVNPAATVNERLFDLLMRRIDVFQTHRAGVLSLLRAVPADPAACVLLAAATLGSMRWMLEAAGVPASGFAGALRTKGLLAVWLWTVREWQSDTSPDLSATMATLDAALTRASQVARSFGLEQSAPPPTTPADVPPAEFFAPSLTPG